MMKDEKGQRKIKTPAVPVVVVLVVLVVVVMVVVREFTGGHGEEVTMLSR